MLSTEHSGLVLEGGGMRGVFTAGVLDAFMEKHITFPYCVAVSAGACNGLSYMSQQIGRAKLSNIDLLKKYGFIGIKYLWSQHSVFDLETMYDRLPNHILPFDYEACFRNPMRFEMVCTNCKTGRPAYLSDQSDRHRLLQICRASSALPYVCPIVTIDGEPYLDGGIVDSIPLVRAMSEGYAHNVVVLTRHRGYRKTERDIRIPRFIYGRYPRLRLLLSRRVFAYNQQLELVEHLEDEGKIVVIRPVKPVHVDRLETNTEKLTALYDEGYRVALETISKL
ncbi:MAG: patatin family protein [Bacteroidaceae bacterium]|nr:patatin family protein [Bacteroidaceae bacterium]